MKTITKYLIRFAIVASVLTIIFRFGLSYGIENKSTTVILVSAVIYSLAMFVSGWHFGKEDADYLPILDVGFRFHLTTFLVHNVISYLWFTFGFASKYENVYAVYSVLLIWTPILFFHFIFFIFQRKKAIKNLNKEDLFD